MAQQTETQSAEDLAVALVRAQKAYTALLYADRNGLSEERQAQLEIDLIKARRAMGVASVALDKAVA